MPDQAYWRALLSGELQGPGYSALRALLAGLSSTYSAGLGLYLAAERVGLRRRLRAPVPVISIGNLCVGGTGKTPMAQLIASRLQGQGWRVALLSRGYRGGREATEAV